MITPQLLKLIEMQAKLVGGLSLQTIAMMAKLWNEFRGWTDYDLNIANSARSATTIEAASRAARQRQRTYLKFIYKEMGIPMPTDDAINRDGGLSAYIPGGVEVYLREGVTPLEVYQRPAEEYRYWLSTGLRPNEALVKSLERVATIADTDLSLTRRDESRRVFRNTEGSKVIGYRRIIHPEQSQDGTSCGLCVVASTRLYKTSELMPIHNECNCDVLPVTLDNDPGHELNQDDIQAIYDAAAQTRADAQPGDSSNDPGDLLKTKVSFTNHGELGPIISSGNRQGSKQRAAAKDRSPLTPIESIDKELHTLKKSAEKLAVRASKGEDVRQYLGWMRDRISILERRATAIRRQQ